MSSHTADPKLDPYTAKAESVSVTPQEKIDGLKKIVKAARCGMLTTRSKEGAMHSRAMAPADYETLHFLFLGNNASSKFEEIENDSSVNLSFYDPSTTDWASIAGTAKIINDKALIKKHWSSFMKGYFENLGDGVHKGGENDPRVSIIEVIPHEIRTWTATSGKIGQTIKAATGAITGKASPPGELRLLTKTEIEIIEGLNRVQNA